MGPSDAFIRATINRLGARIGHGLADAAAEMAVLAQGVPSRLRQEWDLFQEEVRAEADRLERDEGQAQPEASASEMSGSETASASEDQTPQAVIDRLRASVADINQSLEVRS